MFLRSSKLKSGNIGTFAAISFYLIVGILCLTILPMTDFPPHIGIIGILNLITAYGLYKKRRWAIWAVSMLFFVATTFSAYTLFFTLLKNPLLSVSLALYLILTWISTIYTVSRKA